ncbi:hypothetical protein HA402_008638 [Bradysia odoriphaga]|nr:hypothetical protein HA402_008638 [Bradysia odoriphaga]
MMYQHSVSGVGCSGNSPTTSTPPNINTCSSTTPPLTSNQQNPSQNEGSNEQMGNQGSNHHVSNCQSISSNNADGDDDVWRGHSIAALRRRASELNSSIPSYLHHNYEHHSSVY